MLRCVRYEVSTLRCEPLSYPRRADGLGKRDADTHDRIVRRSGRSDYAVPRGRFKAREAGLVECRDVGQQAAAPQARHRQAVQAPGPDMWMRRRDRREVSVYVSTEQASKGEPVSPVRHMQCVQPSGSNFHEFRGEVRGAARSRGGYGHVAGLRPNHREQIGKRRDLRRRVDRKYVVVLGDARDELEVPLRVIVEVGKDADTGREGFGDEQQGMTIGRRLRDTGGREATSSFERSTASMRRGFPPERRFR